MQFYTAHRRFGPDSGDRWSSFIEWSGFRHVSEVVTTDELLGFALIDELIDEDWKYNIHSDCKMHFFRDLEYLKRRVGYRPELHNLLLITERPDSPTPAPDGFEFCGYDILDSFEAISVLTNCGGFPSIFSQIEVNRYCLLDELARADEIAAAIRLAEPEEPHCHDCRVWSICRYAGSTNERTTKEIANGGATAIDTNS
jgi:hypothetical protein